MYCSNCARELPADAAFCPGCGAAIVSSTAGPSGAAAGGAAAGGAKESRVEAFTDRLVDLLGDTWHAVKLLATHPAGNFPGAVEKLGPRKALQVGIAFGIIFDLCVIFAVAENWPIILRALGVGPSAADYIKAIVWGALPFGLLLGACRLAVKLFHGVGSGSSQVFIAGAALLPASLPFLVLAIFGTQSPGSLLASGLLALGYSVLLLYSGWAHVLKIPEAKASRTIPFVLLLLAFILDLIFVNLF